MAKIGKTFESTLHICNLYVSFWVGVVFSLCKFVFSLTYSYLCARIDIGADMDLTAG